jgi:hypothetical protein
MVQVTVSGRLTATDMGRFEHACSRGLIYHPPHLELDLTRVTHIDALATMLLERLAVRGVHLTWPKTLDSPG